MPAATAAVNALWAAANFRAARLFRRALHSVEELQTRQLMHYLRANRSTEFGRRHGFDAIRSVTEYQRRVPLATYDDFAVSVAEIAGGRRHVLTAEPVRLLEPTSGSTSHSRLVPYTATLAAEFRRGLGPWVVDLYRGVPGAFRGPAYWSISPVTKAHPDHSAGGIPIGFDADSAYLGRASRRLVDAALAVPAAVKRLDDVDVFRYVTLLHLLRTADLSLVSVWSPTFLTLLLDELPGWWDALLDDLASGTISPPSAPRSAPGKAALEALRAGFRPVTPRRVDRLARLDPTDWAGLWPGLRLVSCWADAASAPYAMELAARFPDAHFQPKGLLATEALVSVPLLNAPAPVLAVTSHFFEFLPLDDSGEPDRDRPRMAHQLRRGGMYAVVVTTGGGFYRYQLNDAVEVVGHVGQAPCLRFLGRVDNVSDLAGEKLAERFVADVLDRIFRETGVSPRFALLAPETGCVPPRYHLYVEWPRNADPARDPVHPAAEWVAGPTAESVAGIAAALERELSRNFHYAECRALGQLGEVRVVPVRDGAGTYVEACRARGQRTGDIKPVVLDRRTDWGERFRAIAGPAR
ncbi:MAG TPA: GH3 auxin-responsive promoter family protein [Longimicrobiales bacterium]|nr:GH3 auxin-responsive promoter family protein [Longimicrobiales bacterium]